MRKEASFTLAEWAPHSRFHLTSNGNGSRAWSYFETIPIHKEEENRMKNKHTL
jgi:hypothetical protein